MSPKNPIEKKIIARLHTHPRLDRRCIAVSERDGVVTLAGAVEDLEALRALSSCAAEAAPACRVVNLATVSAGDAQRFAADAARLKREIDTRVPEADIDVAVLGSAVVLRGFASRRDRSRVEKIALQAPWVETSLSAVARV